ncbi:MAG: DUF488 domain-containing protein [Chloroflexi bacterium]|nr:DUF488 domain-containing protein [Chloroflexota bacterium]
MMRNDPARQAIFTVGHSVHSPERFIDLLRDAGVEAVVDVRSQPFSRQHPHFDRRQLRELLRSAGISYAFMGDTLGGRPQDSSMYDSEGHVDYARVAASAAYQSGVSKLLKSIGKYRLALLCSEEDPAQCHRHLLVAKTLVQRGCPADDIVHIRSRGRRVTESELVHQLGLAFEGGAKWRSPQSVLHKVQRSTSSSDYAVQG